jgi:predicted NUDIX family NTP pyrophosphohydrolase
LPRRSAGILLYRLSGRGSIEVLIAHPGGPAWANRDTGAWSIPKGELEDGEAAWAVARREFEEETGHAAPAGKPIELGEVRQRSGKVVEAWALEGDLDPAAAVSNTFALEWPPRSGRWITIPEVDRVEWVSPEGARERLNPAQIVFVERLLDALTREPGAARSD